MNDTHTVVNVERVFSETGNTIEDIYMSYIADRIVEIILAMSKAQYTNLEHSEKSE